MAADAIVTFLVLLLVERHVCYAYVMTMPRGIYEALFPRFFSQGGREIVPAVITEGARELALRTLTPRLVSFGRKTDDLTAIR